MGRAPCCDKANVKKGPWSAEEDAKLKDFIEKYGTGGNWISLPQKAGLRRCGKSCRLRWLNYLRPNIKHGEFSEEEDRVICTLYASIGSRWSIIASQLPGRTDNDIKNYWNTKLKKKLMGINYPSNQRKPSLPFQSSLHPTSQIQAQPTMMPTLSGFMSSLSPSENFLLNNSTPLNQYYSSEMENGMMNLGRYNNIIEGEPVPNWCLTNMVMFGGNNEAASCSSSDGSYCSQMSFGNIQEMKQETMSSCLHQGYPLSNGYEDEQNFALDYGRSRYGDVLSTGYFGNNPSQALLFQGYDDNLSRPSSNNNSDGSFYFYNDENKTHQGTMYFD